jgi:hypothetical protein
VARVSPRALHRRQHFDLVHHITFAVWRYPSFMGRLGIPFVFGPIGGGEQAPRALLRTAPLRARVVEALRRCGNRLAAYDPWVRSTFRRAAIIFCKTQETWAIVPRWARGKCLPMQDVACGPALMHAEPQIGCAPRSAREA